MTGRLRCACEALWVDGYSLGYVGIRRFLEVGYWPAKRRDILIARGSLEFIKGPVLPDPVQGRFTAPDGGKRYLVWSLHVSERLVK